MSYMRGVIPTVSHGASHLFSSSNQTLMHPQFVAVTVPVIYMHLELQYLPSSMFFCFDLNLKLLDMKSDFCVDT